MVKLASKTKDSKPRIQLPILLFIAINLVLGMFMVRDYGESWDELKFYRYADVALRAYSEWWRGEEVPTFDDTYDNYGPAYVMGINMTTHALDELIPSWSDVELRHLVYFITFQTGVYFFYLLCLRWMRAGAAFGAAVLFATQPIFFGHAFFSPKDIPFMVFFIASIYFGLKLGDRLSAIEKQPQIHLKSSTVIITIIWLISLGMLMIAMPCWLDSIAKGIQTLYQSEPETFFGRMFTAVASNGNEIGAAAYIQKTTTLFKRFHLLYLILSPILMLVHWWKLFPKISKGVIFPTVLAGVFLGLASSIRILGPFAGVMVSVFLLAKLKKKAVPILILYAGISILTAYLTWPYLWADLAGNFIESLTVMTRYPWSGQVLFDSQFYASTEIPRSYLLTLLAIQFTEPVWILFFLGFGTVVWFAVKKRKNVDLLSLSILWFWLPVSSFILLRSPLYDNFRQIFFILPPIFFLAGYTLDQIFLQIDQKIIRVLFILVVVFPGIFKIIQLHPYEYIYYNRLIGGEQGAYRRFELDYWGLSFFETAEYLNANAPPNANIWVNGPIHLLPLRPDLNAFYAGEGERAEYYDFVVATTRYDKDLQSYPDVEIIHTIERNGAVLTVIKGSTQNSAYHE